MLEVRAQVKPVDITEVDLVLTVLKIIMVPAVVVHLMFVLEKLH
jgi:hypothetical protein